MIKNSDGLRVINLLKPKKFTLALLPFLALLLSIIPTYYSYTTKITWDEFHGIPLTYLKLTGCFGPCGGEGISRKYFLQEFNIFFFLADIFTWYVAVCLVVYGVSFLLQTKKIRAIITRKR